MNMETAAQSMKELKGRADSSATHSITRCTGQVPLLCQAQEYRSSLDLVPAIVAGSEGTQFLSAGQTRTLSVISVARRAT